MPETTNKGTRLAKVAKQINLGIDSVVEHLRKKGFEVEAKPTTKITEEMYNLLLKEFKSDIDLKQRAEQVNIGQKKREKLSINPKGGVKAEEGKEVAKSEEIQQAEKLTEELLQSTIQKEKEKETSVESVEKTEPVEELQESIEFIEQDVEEETPVAEKVETPL